MKQLLYGILIMLAWQGFHPGGALAQIQPEIEISLAEGSPDEEAARQQLRRLLERYALSPWIFTDRVLIQAGVRAHSHPVLTLNTRFLDQDDKQLSFFVHEQLHWYLEAEAGAREEAIEDLRRMYPEVPVGGSEGARSEYSTYLHLLVGWLEWRAMICLSGEAQAREVYTGMKMYRWIYERVLDDDAALGRVMEEHGLVISLDRG